MLCIEKILKFYRSEFNRLDLYTEYIYRLYRIHIKGKTRNMQNLETRGINVGLPHFAVIERSNLPPASRPRVALQLPFLTFCLGLWSEFFKTLTLTLNPTITVS